MEILFACGRALFPPILVVYLDISPQGITVTPRVSDPIRRASHPQTSTVQGMSVNPGRAHVFVTQ